MEEPFPKQKLCCEDVETDGNDTMNDEHVGPPPTHKDALQCASQLITNSTAQPHLMDDLSCLYNNITTQWTAAKMSMRQKETSAYTAVN
jgi:hypothetical protein